ncbi:MAG: hypothetical protein HY653_02810, partial [Acidobacteria bacterium]|nr:hypothetical protein [Acidobacteriota bacterium]
MMIRRLATRSLYPIFVGSAVAVLVGIGIVYWLGEVDFLASWTLALALLLLGLAPLWWEYRRGTFDLFNLKNAFVGYYIVQFGVWTLWVLVTGDTKFLGDLRAWDTGVQLALLAALAGLGSFFLGYYLHLGDSLGRRLPVCSPHWNSLRLVLLAGLLLFLGILSCSLIVSGWGGWRDFLSELGPARIEGIRGKGYFLLMAWFFPSLVLLFFYAKALESKSGIFYALTGCVFLLQVGIGFSLGYRAYAFFPLLQLFCL